MRAADINGEVQRAAAVAVALPAGRAPRGSLKAPSRTLVFRATSGSRSLAMLEMLVQDNALRAYYVVIPATIPPRVVIERVSPDDLPPDWRDPAGCERLQAIGTVWARERRSAVLAVPSALIPAELNYLLNPLHPSFDRIGVGGPEELVTDLRLI